MKTFAPAICVLALLSTGAAAQTFDDLAANAFEKVNWASHVDKETGRPVETDIAKSIRG